MDVAVGLPARPVEGRPYDAVGWAQAADAGPFSSLVVGDRVVAPAHEALVLLATAAGVTRRIRLMASLVVGPARETSLLARQAASIDALSGGRLSLGLGVGARADDYRATGMDFADRGRRFDVQLERLRSIWTRDGAVADAAAIGVAPARPGGPELLVGGYVPAVAERIARWGDGFMAPGGGDPEAMRSSWTAVQAAWTKAGRRGQPRWVAGSYYALGPGADQAALDYIHAYYAYDPAVAERRARDIPTSPRQVVDRIRRAAGDGVDELILRPVIADPAMVERLADLVGGGDP